jgi:Papain family cysteine protease
MALNTVGELRRDVAAQGLKWTVNPKLSDDTPITRPHSGGLLDKSLQVQRLPRVDVDGLVAATPPTNALLRAHLVQRGLLPAAEGGTPLASPGSTGVAGTAGAVTSGGSGSPSSRPTVADWRNRFGWSWFTKIRDQDPCEHCWIYASTALVEAMVRIEHCVWCVRSEGEYIQPKKVTCGQCGWPGPVLDFWAAHGVADLDCVPWADRDPDDHSGPYWNPPPHDCNTGSNQAPPEYAPCKNRDGRTVKIPPYTLLGDIDDQKNWIDAVGPLVVYFELYSDFEKWVGDQPYVKSANATLQGGHYMLAAGYDDIVGCWIVKNSWGTGFGNDGWWLIAYGQCNIDSTAKLGLRLTNPDPWTKRRNHNGGMIESGNGEMHCNFELLVPSKGNSFTHWRRDNASASLRWSKAEVLGNDVTAPLTFTSTTYNRNFEAVYPTTGGRLHHRWFDQTAKKWNTGVVFGPISVVGPAGFVESSNGPGDFDVVTAIASNELQHWWRDSAGNWHQGATFGSNVAAMGPTLLQSTSGNLQLVCVLASGQMQHWCRIGSNAAWTADQTFGSGITSAPCMIQGQYGMANEYDDGNFELCVALPNGTVQHWRRNKQVAKNPWAMSATFGSKVDRVIALLEGSFGFNLEVVVVRTDCCIQHYWRDSSWNEGVVIGRTD